MMNNKTADTTDRKRNAARHWLGLPGALTSLLCLATCNTLAADAVGTTAAGAANPPLILIRQFLDGAPSWGEERSVRMRGTVTHSISDRTFFIQEADAGTYVFHKPGTAFRVGEMVEVTGVPSLGTLAPTLQRCKARSIGPGTLQNSRLSPSAKHAPSDATCASSACRAPLRPSGCAADERRAS